MGPNLAGKAWAGVLDTVEAEVFGRATNVVVGAYERTLEWASTMYCLPWREGGAEA